jgi:hypothetical protein
MQHPLWREDGSVVYSCCWSSPSQVRIPPDTWPYFTVSGSRRPQLEGPGPHIYLPQEEGGSVVPPGTGFPFRRLLRLAGLMNLIWTPRQSHIATDGQSVSKSWCRAPSGAHDQIFITVWLLRSSFLRGALSNERTGLSFVYAALPAQTFSSPSPLVLATIFYCLRFETFLFVASYDSQDHGGGIRSRLHTGVRPTLIWTQVKVTLRLTVSRSVSLGVEPHLGLMTRYLLLFDSYGLVLCGAPFLSRGRFCHLYMLLILVSASSRPFG